MQEDDEFNLTVATVAAEFPGFPHSMLWTFGRRGRPYTGMLRCLPDGRIGGYVHSNESFWRLGEEGLTFLDSERRPSTVFDRAAINAAGLPILTGSMVYDQAVTHRLEAVADPHTISTAPEKFPIDDHRTGPRRRNLVIMGANEESLHHQWPQDVPDSERNWDLCLSFYGAPENYPPPGPYEYASRQPGVRKWIAIHAAMYEGSPFWDYERIFVIDDDILTSWSDINRFLDICEAYDLQLAQPSLKPDCFLNHEITAQKPGSLLRFTTFVEAMAPCFARAALRQCIAVTQGAFYGWGIDHLWPMILGAPRDKLAIVDAVAIAHTRPLAVTYPRELAAFEEQELYQCYGNPDRLGVRELTQITLPDGFGTAAPVPAPSSGELVNIVTQVTGSVVFTKVAGLDIRFFVTNPADLIQLHHARGEFYEMEELAIIGAYFPNGGVFLDIGTNIGNHSVFVAKFFHASQIIVIEPNPAAITILKTNVSLNDLTHLVDATHLGVGLSDAPGYATPFTVHNNLGETRMFDTEDAGGLRLVRGDDLFQDRRIDFIKMDVEGMEIRALAGMAETIARWRPPIFIEVDNVNAAAFQDWMKHNDYLIAQRFQRYPVNENFMLVPAGR
jgi:FkbM family methyltransferase